MPQTVFILGASGQIGRATALRFAREGWTVRLAGRDRAKVPAALAEHEFAPVDRNEPAALERALGEPDVLVDVVAFTAEHGEQLRALAERVGSAVVISSGSVYADETGRTVEGSATHGFPELPVPIPETQRTVDPGPETYSTNKAALEQAVLADERLRATVVRPCAIHGPGAELPRELFFVQRARDGRRPLVLAHRGASRFHTTSVDNLAELIWLAAARPGRRVVNCGDPNPPAVIEIARAVAAHLGHEFVEVLLPGEPQDGVGRNPWAVPRPLVLDMLTAELELRYRPVTTYERAVRATVDWLVEANAEPQGYMADMFDYASEDAFLATLAPLERVETDG